MTKVKKKYQEGESIFWCIPPVCTVVTPETCAFSDSFSVLHHFCGELLHLCVSVSDVHSIRADHHLPVRHASASATHWTRCRVILRKQRAADKHTGIGEGCKCMCKGAARPGETKGKMWREWENKRKTTCVTLQFALWSFIYWCDKISVCLLPADWYTHMHTNKHVPQVHVCLRLLDSSTEYLKPFITHYPL